MNQINAAPSYSQDNEASFRRTVMLSDGQNMKIGYVFDSIKLRDTVTGVVKTLTVASGSLVIT